jgi:hypothetical protein
VGSLEGLGREVGRLEGELGRVRREGEEDRRRAATQEAHFRTGEQVEREIHGPISPRQELRNRIAILETELRQERGRGQVGGDICVSSLPGGPQLHRLQAAGRVRGQAAGRG